MIFLKKKLRIAAPAKVNLHLEILDRRQDGFHNIESIFLAVDFGDTLRFKLSNRKKTTEISINGLDLGLPIEKNTIFRSINLFRERTGFSEGLKVTVEKRIPAGGGLGGGSSDAAASLLALNELAGFPLNRAALLETAAALGSDVPFFIYQTAAALVSGRGDIIEPIKAPRLFFVLVNPGFSSGTAAAFRLLDEYRIQNHLKEKEGIEKMLADDPARWGFRNDFLPVFGEKERAVYNEIIDRLWDLGAGFAGLSGSGSTCFGVFLERASARRAAKILRGEQKFVESCASAK